MGPILIQPFASLSRFIFGRSSPGASLSAIAPPSPKSPPLSSAPCPPPPVPPTMPPSPPASPSASPTTSRHPTDRPLKCLTSPLLQAPSRRRGQQGAPGRRLQQRQGSTRAPGQWGVSLAALLRPPPPRVLIRAMGACVELLLLLLLHWSHLGEPGGALPKILWTSTVSANRQECFFPGAVKSL